MSHKNKRQKRHQRGWGVGALKCHSRDFSRNNPNTTIPVRAMGVGSRWQGRVIPLWPEKFFHFDHYSDQKLNPGMWKMACLEPLPGNIPAHALGTSLIDVIPMTTVKSIGRNFSRGGLPGAPQPFSISRYGGLNPEFWSLQWSKWNIFGSWGGHGPPCQCLPTTMMTVLRTKRV